MGVTSTQDVLGEGTEALSEEQGSEMCGYREEGKKPLWQPSPDQVGQNHHLTPTLRDKGYPESLLQPLWERHEARRMLDTKGWCR